jgi:hypothetical protein
MPSTPEEARRYYEKNRESIIESSKEYYQKNKQSRGEYQKAYYAANKDKFKEYQKRYKEVNKFRTKADIIALWIKRCTENGVPEKCEICLSKFDIDNRKAIHWDHDHDTGEFRGWLCNRCNCGIGLLGDCPDRLTAASEYIRQRSPQKSTSQPHQDAWVYVENKRVDITEKA